MSNAKDEVIPAKEPPKIPTLSLPKRPSMFSGGPRFFGPKAPQTKFKQATFHTQHKGGPSGGGGGK